MANIRSFRSLLPLLGVAVFFLFASSSAALAPTSMGGPQDGMQGVPVEAFIDRQFDVAMSGATVTTSSVLLQTNTGNAQGGAATGPNLCLTVSLIDAGRRIMCEHMSDGPLTANTWYSITYKSTLASSTGATLGADVRYQFQTTSFAGGNDFISPPVVIGSVPRGGVKLPSNAKIRIYFDPGGSGTGTTMSTSGPGSVMALANIKLFAAENGRPANDTNLLACSSTGASVAHPTNCNMAWQGTGSGQQLVITPGKKSPWGTQASTGGSELSDGSQYVLIVKGQQGPPGAGATVKNSQDIPLMGEYYVTFTATGADTLGPTTKGTYPQNGTQSIDRAIYNISVGFTESVDDASVTENTIELYADDGDQVFGTGADLLVANTYVDFFPDRDEAIISPSVLLDSTKWYYVLIRTGVKDIAGNNFDGDRAAAGNQNKVISFKTGALTNGQATDDTKPRISFANANNFSVAVTFSEPLQFDKVKNDENRTSDNPFVVNNVTNWTLESPSGSSVNLAGKPIFYEPGSLTLIIEGVMLPPNQTFRIKAATSSGALRIKDLAGNVVDGTGSGNIATGTVQSVHDMGRLGPDQGSGEFDFFTGGMKPTRVSPRAGLAGATTTYEVEFPANQVIPLGGTVVLTFPTGFSFVADGGSTECRDAVTTIDNSDINGPSTGTVTIASIACSASARTVTVTTAGAATVAGDRIRFILQGIVNSPVPKDFTTSGYTVDIKTKNVNGSVLESKSSMPFFLSTPGTQYVRGVVFVDGGGGGGTANNGIKDGAEVGVASIKVCMGGMMGFSCQATTATGAYAFELLGNGFYKLDIPPLTSGDYVGGPFFRDVNLSGGQSRDGVNFALRASEQTITANITGIPTGTNLDVFVFNPMNPEMGGQIIREALWNGSTTRAINIPVSDGTWEVGVGPWMPKDPSMGPPSMPDMNFMPPRPQQVKVSGAGTYEATFAIQAANRTVVGSVKDGGGTAIPNAFLLARPTDREAMGGGVAQSKNDGTFSLKVRNGVYQIDAVIPGMPPTGMTEITVKDDSDSGATDGNSEADVYSNGALITVANPLQLKIAKGDRSISGRVLDESGNAIAYAFVEVQEVNASGDPIGPHMGSPTDSSGNFTVYVRDGRWKVFGFTPEYGELPSLTVVVAGSSVSGQNLQASSADFGTITGTVKKGSTPVVGAFVDAFGSGGGNHTISGSGGVYTLKVRAGAGYQIRGHLPGVGDLAPDTGVTLTGLTVTANQTISGKNLVVATPGTLKVTLTGSTTISDAFVEARDANGRGNGTNANPTPGVYEFSVPAGTYRVEARNPKSGLLGSQSSVAITAGQTTTINLTPPALYTVAGTVASVSANCTNSPSVAFSDASNGRATMTSANASGVFSITLPNGTYRVTAGKSGCVDNAAAGSVTVNGAAVSGVSRTLTAADATISGRVSLSSTGVTIPTKVIAENSAGNFAFADVDTSRSGGGTNYTLNVSAGTWTITARSEGYASTSATVTIIAGGSETQNITLTAIAGYTRRDPKSSTVTPSRGGIVRDANIGSGFEVNLPAGALGNDSDSASVTTKETTAIATQTPTATVLGGKAIVITPKTSAGQAISDLSTSAEITIPYTEADVTAAGTTEDKLLLAVWSEEKNQWEPLPTTVNTTDNTLTATTNHFSTIGTVAPQGGGSSNAPGDSSPAATSTSTTTSGGGGGGRRSLTTVQPTQTYPAAPAAAKPAARVVTPGELQSVRNVLKMTVGSKSVVFRDIPVKAWFAPYVASVIQSGIASGYKDPQGNLTGEFGPARNITYAEIAKMALEGSGQSPDAGAATVRNSSARGHWAAGYVQLMETRGASVYTDRLDINANANRGAVMQTLVEILDISEKKEAATLPAVVTTPATTGSGAVTGSGATQTGSGSALTGSGSSVTGTGTVILPAPVPAPAPSPAAPAITFKDLPENHPNAAAITLLVKLGVITGDTKADGTLKGTVRPNAPINRAEVSKIFTKLIELRYVK